MMFRATGLLTVALAVAAATACNYEPPLNPDYVATNTIAGTVVADGVDEPGMVWVFIFDAKAPPPPVGTGAPITFATIPASAFTGGSAGVQSAAFAVPYLADTTEKTGFEAGYLVTALMDMDGNFNPFTDALGGSTCGDWLGEHKASLGDQFPVPVFVEGGELKDDVTININRQNATQRPAFTIDLPEGETFFTISKQTAAASLIDQAGNTQSYRIKAVGVHTNYPAECLKTDKECNDLPLDLEGPCIQDPEINDSTCTSLPACECPVDIQEPCQTGFPVRFVDEVTNGDPAEAGPDEGGPDGLHDWYPAELQRNNEIRNTWPKLFLDYKGIPSTDADNNTIFENELGSFEWPPGSGRVINERWVAENYPLALDLVIPGMLFVHPDGLANPFQGFTAKEMNITFSPAFRHYHANGSYGVDAQNGPWDLYDLRCYASPSYGDGNFPSGDPAFPHPATCTDTPVTLDDVPNGAWQLIMITESGQSWRLPNEVGLPAWAALDGIEAPLESTSPDFDTASQGVFLLLED